MSLPIWTLMEEHPPRPPRSRNRARRLALIGVALVVVILVVVHPGIRIGGDHQDPGRDGATLDHPSWTASQLPDWKTSGYRPRALTDGELRGYGGAPLPLDHPRWPVDQNGVTRWRYRGKWWYHPNRLAQYGLEMLNGWSATRDVRYRHRAYANAQKLLDIARESRGGLWFPFPFDFNLHGNPRDRMIAPWYSGLTEGLALQLFTRIQRLRANAGTHKWLDAARRTFQTFLEPPRRDEPWDAWVDADGYLWLELYPKDPPMRVLNGHLQAAFGIFDYLRATGDPRARKLWDGALTTVRHYASQFRRPGQLSLYCLRVRFRSLSYHRVVVTLLRYATKVSGDRFFSDQARLWSLDAR